MNKSLKNGSSLKKGSEDGKHKFETENEENELAVYGYKRHMLLTIVTWFFIIITVGLLRIVFHWSPHWMLKATHKRCGLHEAEKVLLIERYQKKHTDYSVKDVVTLSITDLESEKDSEEIVTELKNVKKQNPDKLSYCTTGGDLQEVDSLRMFKYKKLRYIWDDNRHLFAQLHGLDQFVKCAEFYKSNNGLTEHQQKLRRFVYGENDIQVPVKTVWTLLFLEVLNPFYMFQVFSVCLWFSDHYYYYAVAIIVMSAFGISSAIIQTRRNQENLRSTVTTSDVASVMRGSIVVEAITTNNLVPGDVIVIPTHGCIMNCDAVLISGNCIVNESMLTGESVPVTKTPLPNSLNEIYDSKEHARHTLFCGTRVIQTRYYGEAKVCAVVVRTGFSTSKGELVRSIMYPPPVDFKFEQDSYKFVEILGCIASIGFIYTVITKHLNGVPAGEIAVEALDLITIAVPPALPAAMTVGRMYAQRRLKNKNIYCISPRSINVSGSIDCVCFDKTGTLTEDGLDMWGVVPFRDANVEDAVHDLTTLPVDHILKSLLTCHSITIIDGELSGDPLDLKMFESTGWELEEPMVSDETKFEMVIPTVIRRPLKNQTQVNENEIDFQLGVLRQFPFSSSLQRMSVITKTTEDTELVVYCKGAPEMIHSLSRPESVPENFMAVVETYSQQGYRVLAVGYKVLKKISFTKMQKLQRDEVECELNLLGLIVMENKLKLQTRDVIKQLKDIKITTIMITGDNMLTALSVARDCGIVSPGQRVIIVNVHQPTDGKPVIYFTDNNPPTVPQTPQNNGDLSQMTASTSINSLATLETGSVVIDLDYTPSISIDYSFAVTGKTWAVLKNHYPELIPKIITRGSVFARMSPDQKQNLVQELQALGYYVAMCGDGANDCGALKAAHTGISLSEAESSVASPFTSTEANISCVPLVIQEGRAALVTSFGIFKYMAAYSLTQFVSVMLLYSIGSNLTDIEFLYIDLCIITLFAFFFGKTESYPKLAKHPPLTSLVSVSPILSIVLQMLVVIGIQVAAFYHVQVQSWFVSFQTLHEQNPHYDDPVAFENYAVFSVSMLQYIILAVIFSKGKPYRKAIFTNIGFMLCLIVLTGFSLYLIFYPAPGLKTFFDLVAPPNFTFPLIILGYGAVNLILAFFIEYIIIDFLCNKLRYRFHKVDKSRRKYLAIEKVLKKDLSWPSIIESSDILKSNGISIISKNVENNFRHRETISSDKGFDQDGGWNHKNGVELKNLPSS